MTTKLKQPEEEEEEAEPSMADIMLEVLRRRQAERAAEIPLFLTRADLEQ